MEASTGVTGWTLLKQYLLTPALDLIFPPVCVGCHRVGMILCKECQASIKPQLHHPGNEGEPSAIVELLALGTFRGILQQAVHNLKYDGQTALANPLGNLLATAVRAEGWPPGLVIPVPLHSDRLIERGFNQSALLGAAIAHQLGWPFSGDILTRVRYTASQVGLGRQARQENVRDAFHVNRPEVLRGMTVVLVDDVYTTGATLRECASAMYTCGAQAVRALVIGLAMATDPGLPPSP
jgi:competence protein ComFC